MQRLAVKYKERLRGGAVPDCPPADDWEEPQGVPDVRGLDENRTRTGREPVCGYGED